MKKTKTKKTTIMMFFIGYLIVVAAVLVWKIQYADKPSSAISIAGAQYSADTTAFTVTSPNFDYSQLAQFHSLQSVDVTALEIDGNEYERICSQLGEQIKVFWNVPFNGTRLRNDTSELNISSEIGEAEQSLLSYFTNLTDVTVTNIDSFEKVYPIIKRIRQSNPDVRIQCSTTLYGMPLDSSTETLILNNIQINNTDDLCHALEVFPRLKKVEMCGCGLSDDVMGQLREMYPEVSFVWIIHFLKYYVRTDAQVFSTLAINYSRPGDSESFSPLFRYCTELRALDLGHMRITDISEIRNLKKLHTLILADNYISDISPLADLKELNYIELFQNNIQDISPLLELPRLEDLNICYNPHVENPTSITRCKTLKRLYYSHCGMSQKDITAVREGIADNCEFNWTAANCVYDGWRDNAKNQTIRTAFKNWSNVKEYPSWDNIIYK